MANPRGVITVDVPSSLTVVENIDSAAVIAFGTAPVHTVPGYSWGLAGSGASPWSSVVNTPVLVEIPGDFTTQLGESSNFGPGVTNAYTLCEVYDAMMVENSCSPMVCVNVFDPWTMSTPVVKTGLHVSALNEIAITGEVILASLVVTGASNRVYTQGVDYSYEYSDSTLQTGQITVFNTSALVSETSVSVSFYTPNFSAVTGNNGVNAIVGGVTVAGENFGLEVLEDVYHETNIVPALVIAPGFGANVEVVAAAVSHVQNIANGRFRAVFVGSMDASVITQYGEVNAAKDSSNFESAFHILGWPHVGLGTKKYHAETMACVQMAQTDKAFGGIPYVSFSNKSAAIDRTILSSGQQITVNYAQADYLEQLGVFTYINSQGWKSQGDYTCAYGAGDLQEYDFFLNERRMFCWLGNVLSIALANQIDMPGNVRTLTSIQATIQAFLNTLVAAGAANTARCSFNPNLNLASQVMAGEYVFSILWTPPTPIRTLELQLQYDVAGLAAWISSISIPSS